MNSTVRIFLTMVVAAGLATATVLLTGLALPFLLLPAIWVPVLVVAGLNGLYAGALGSYDLTTGKGWFTLFLDHTWSLPSTLFGAVFANAIYIFFANPSTAYSAGQTWISYKPRSATGFGNNVLQTVGTVNIGGAGNHELVHLLQHRIFGPAFLPFVVLCYTVTGLIQVLFTITLGLILWLAKVRDKPYFRPPARSAVPGFFGWIYYATPIELWAYGTEP